MIPMEIKIDLGLVLRVEPNKVIRSVSTRLKTALLCWIIKGHIMKAYDSY